MSTKITNGSLVFGDNTTLSSANVTQSQLTGAPTNLSQFTNNLGNYYPFITIDNLSHGAVFIGSISGTNLTVTSIISGSIAIGNNLGPNALNGVGVANGTYFVSQTSGTTGGTGVYVVSVSQNLASTKLYQMTLSGYYAYNEYGPRYLNWNGTTLSINANNCNCNCNC